MLTLIVAGTAAGLSAPSAAMAFTHNDYPTWALQKEASAAGAIHVVADPSGKVVQCVVTRAFGDAKLAKDVCGILRRKRLQPATLRDGQKVHAFLDTFIRLFLPDTDEGRKIMALRAAPDAELAVTKLPDGNSAEVGIILAYDTSGKVTDCGPSDQEKNVKLAGVACSQKALFDNVIQKNESGQPVSYITQKRVLFVAQSPKN